MTKIPLLIDTDPGVDDALALLMAFADEGHDVVGLTIAAGNVGLRHTVANALKLCEVVGRTDVPVSPGCDSPLLHAADDAAYVHGQDGFGDTGHSPATHAPADEHAALAILRLSREHAGKLLLVALGPLTNVALALKLDPTLPQRIARCVVMGGAVTGHGNMTPSAEFNIAFDPEAAHLVFSAFPRIELADWEAVLRHGLPHAAIEGWLAAATPQAAFYGAISAQTRAWGKRNHPDEDWHCADALAMALALQPGHAAPLAERPLAIEIGHGPARGATLVDWDRRFGAASNAAILMEYDQRSFEAQVRQALEGAWAGSGGLRRVGAAG